MLSLKTSEALSIKYPFPNLDKPKTKKELITKTRLARLKSGGKYEITKKPEFQKVGFTAISSQS